MFLRSLFGEQQITESCYSAVYANQDDDVMKATLADLNRDSPKIRLVLPTSVSGMGLTHHQYRPCYKNVYLNMLFIVLTVQGYYQILQHTVDKNIVLYKKNNNYNQ
jgi:hypothetical protein